MFVLFEVVLEVTSAHKVGTPAPTSSVSLVAIVAAVWCRRDGCYAGRCRGGRRLTSLLSSFLLPTFATVSAPLIAPFLLRGSFTITGRFISGDSKDFLISPFCLMLKISNFSISKS
uniref:Uncharacterized protein n=1 Tax=Setaria viridis TaxID=4556 RepID=A0A4U6T278_SETVI|nr:hypothetical protein SEVIR_9G302700v2 [Setaria viridis]